VQAAENNPSTNLLSSQSLVSNHLLKNAGTEGIIVNISSPTV